MHDEIHVLLPDEGGYVSEEVVNRVQEIMCRAMEQVLVGDIPVACEAALSHRWQKEAQLNVENGRVFPFGDEPAPSDSVVLDAIPEAPSEQEPANTPAIDERTAEPSSQSVKAEPAEQPTKLAPVFPIPVPRRTNQ